MLGHQPGIRWYRKSGRDRRELTDKLDAISGHAGVPPSAPGIAHRDDIRRALESLRRCVDKDGSPESEFAVALALALVGHARARVHGWTGPPPETIRLVKW